MESRLQNKKIHILSLGIFSTFLALGLVNPTFADKIFLKNGESSIGKALNVSTTSVDWQEEKGKLRKIPLVEVERIDIGYDGVPVCANFVGNLVNTCDLELHRLTKTSASFTTKTSPLKLEVVPIINILDLKLEFSQDQDYRLYFAPGVKGIWEAKEFKGRGTLVSNLDNTWVIQPEGKKKPPVSIPASEMIGYEFDKGKTVKELVLEKGPMVIPGFVPLQEKKYKKSILLFSGAILSGFGMYYEYNQSVNAINNDREYLPTPDGRVFVVSNVLSTDKYDFHNRRFQTYTTIFSILVAYTLLDSFYLGQIESSTGNVSSVWIKPNIESMQFSREKNIIQPNQATTPFQYSIQVEARF